MSAEDIITRYATFESLRSEFRDPEPHARLGESERAELQRLRDPGRREAWLWGRVVAKGCIRTLSPGRGTPNDRRSEGRVRGHFANSSANNQNAPLSPGPSLRGDGENASIEILTLDAVQKGTRPRVLIDGNESDLSISISHSQRAVFVAVSDSGKIGVDLVDMQDFAPHAMLPWFTTNERQNLETLSPRDIATVWAVKEAIYKAFNEGEPFAPKRIDVHLSNGEVVDVHYCGRTLRNSCDIIIRELDGHLSAEVLQAGNVALVHAAEGSQRDS